jgi:hypothetical protein
VQEVWREYVAGLAGQADVTVPERLDAAADIVIESDVPNELRMLPTSAWSSSSAAESALR